MSIKRTEKLFSLADQLFNEQSVSVLSESLKKACQLFDATGFQSEVLARFPDLELKQRISALVDAMEPRLPPDFEHAVAVLECALPEPLDPRLSDGDFGTFIWGVPGEYVARHGVSEQRLNVSLQFLKQATMRFSSESAIRPFLAAFPDQTMEFVRQCARDDNYHVRRLASEGIRPLLPWAQKVVLPAEVILDVLDQLHADSTRYVTRSVANNMNDLSKSTPQLVLKRLIKWRKAHRQSNKELDWMTRHSLRTLLKQGHPGALEFLGYPSTPAFSVSNVSVSEEVTVGHSLKWQGELVSNAAQKLRIGLEVHFLKANGRHSPKLFAVADLPLKKGERLSIGKSLAFRPLSTRTLYPGTHHVELVVNGVRRGKKPFRLKY